MPNRQPFTIQDGEDTPVDHIFSPAGPANNGVSQFKESDGVPIGDNTLSISLRESDQKHKVRILMALPITVDETVNGVTRTVIERAAFADVTFTFAKSSTTQERENAVALLASALDDNTVVRPVLIDLDGLW